MLKLSFIGDLTVDIYPKLKKTNLGGASLISAMWAKKLGSEVTILAAVGNDEAGKSYQEFFKKNRLSPTFLTFLNIPTSRIEIFLDKNGERSFGKWQPGAFAKYHLEEKEKKFLLTQDAVVLPVYFKTKHLLAELLSLRSFLQFPQHSRPLLVVDFDDLSQFDKKTAIIEKHLSSIDIVKVGLDMDKDKDLIERIKRLSQQTSVRRSSRLTGDSASVVRLFLSSKTSPGNTSAGRTRHQDKIFLITLGPNGSLTFINGKTYRQKAIKVKKVIDATGAGDAFLAGFLTSHLTSQTIQTSLKLGSQIAAKAISQVAAY